MRKWDNFCRAFANLKEGAKLEEPYTIVEQTGIAGLFGICFEQAWKLMKEILEDHGRLEARTGSPRAIIKIAYQCGMIEDCEGWLALLESRNILSHTYSDEQSMCVVRKVKTDYIPLFEALKAGVAKDWM